jgi:hypothetical protein
MRMCMRLRFGFIGAMVFVCSLTLSLCSISYAQPAGGQVTIAGDQKAIGKGTVRTWLKVDAKTRETPKLVNRASSVSHCRRPGWTVYRKRKIRPKLAPSSSN